MTKNASNTTKKPAATKKTAAAAGVDDQLAKATVAADAGGTPGDGDQGGAAAAESSKGVTATAGSATTVAPADAAVAPSNAGQAVPAADAPPASSPAGTISTYAPRSESRRGAGHSPAAGQVADGLVTITVIGPTRGMRRAGHHFDGTPKIVHVTSGELKAIEGDPSLAVTRGAVALQENGQPAAASRKVEDFLDAKGKPVAVKVLGPVKGRRRGGHQFGGGAVTITPASKEELELILGDAELSVSPA